MPRTVVAVALTSLAALAQAPVDPGTSYLFHVANPTPGQRLQVLQHFDVLGGCCGQLPAAGPLDVVVQPEELALFQRLAPTAQLVRRGRPYAEVALANWVAAGTDVPPPEYYTVAEIEAAIDAKVAAYPTLARKVDITALPGGVRTWENRGIFALKVSTNPAIDQDKPAIVLAGQTHARELNAPVMVLGAMDRILAGYATDPALQSLVDTHELWFVPMMNPDGVNWVWTADDLWRKNRRNNGTSFGVDNNRNYPFLWTLCGGSTLASSETYRGPAAASEPEVQAMRNFVATVRPELYLDFHSYGQDVLNLWAPCATVSAAWQTFNQRYVDSLRTPMAFSFRAPSASAEAPHDFWGNGGSLSYLIEVGTAFQPAYSATVAEEARVWPGVRTALTGWQPTLRGHVRSSNGRTPVAATMTFTPNQFAHGEVTHNRGRDGRYAMWLPLGSWNVTFAAPGHQSRTFPVAVTGYDSPQVLEVELDPVWTTPSLVKSGSERIGTNVDFTYTSPGDAGRLCLFGWSLGTAPGMALGGSRVVPLNNDFLMQSQLTGNPVFAAPFAVLDQNGQATATMALPNLPFAIGLTTWVGGITSDPAYGFFIMKWSQPVSVTPLP